MSLSEITATSIKLAGEVGEKLGRWLELFEVRLAAAEEGESPPDLKDIVAFTTALKRILEIARIAEALEPEANHGGRAALDPEILRSILAQED